ncbi:C39 family peptidase [Sphingomicrobium aestuariivivum]|uniref:C39 family peptidase n=1 Tax=Sphingomicrobium aestuariivivum TaxID=1582356 RepID=UPI001FD6B09B|nr:cysteine peptidase family C39 domain-containing protein [Sphingomicrobium aestuariivivum]MCJ8191899.1 cysteine peptidase family C39 domain-containing protein [Sphingomicrobium aestuariivivum]
MFMSMIGLSALAAAPDGARPVASLLEQRHEAVVVQQWDLSCGAAALATLLNHQHGEAVTEREVAAMLVDRPEYLDHPWIVRARHGFSLHDLRRVARRYGYEGIGLGNLTMEGLDLLAPLIVPVDFTGYPHFVIYRGREGGEVLLADPAFGNRTMTADRFERAWMEDARLGRIGFRIALVGDAGVTAGALAFDRDQLHMVRP